MGFKWATEFCSSAHFIITTDDDVYVNINGLFRTLLIHDSSLKTYVAGICEMGSLRDTNASSKWYVSPREYHYRRYYGICHGFGNITSIHTLQKICQYTIHLFRRCINTKSPTQCALDTTIRKQTQITLIRHEPSYKQLEVKTNQPSFVYGNHNTEPKTSRHII